MINMGRGIVSEEAEGKLCLVLSKEMYQKEAVFQAAYKFTDKCHILIEPVDDKNVGVYFQLIPENEIDLKDIALEFCNEVLDQQVRLDLEKHYGPLRDLIVRQAFRPISDHNTQPKSKD